MATQLKYENGMLIPENRDYPPVELLYNSANRHLEIRRVLDKKRNPAGSIVLFTAIIVLAVAVNTLLTLAVQ